MVIHCFITCSMEDLDNPFAMCQNRQIIITLTHPILNMLLIYKSSLFVCLIKVFLQFWWLTNAAYIKFDAVLPSLHSALTASRKLFQVQIWTFTALTDGRSSVCFFLMATTSCVHSSLRGFIWCNPHWILTGIMCHATIQEKLIILTSMDPAISEDQTGMSLEWSEITEKLSRPD